MELKATMLILSTGLVFLQKNVKNSEQDDHGFKFEIVQDTEGQLVLIIMTALHNVFCRYDMQLPFLHILFVVKNYDCHIVFL